MQKRLSHFQTITSGLPRSSDISGTRWDFAFGPKAEVRPSVRAMLHAEAVCCETAKRATDWRTGPARYHHGRAPLAGNVRCLSQVGRLS
jgi:hypothetical protein